MRNATFALWAAAGLVILAGCSNSSKPSQSFSIPAVVPRPEGTFIPALAIGPRPAGWLSAEVRKAIPGANIFVTSGSKVLIYPAKPPGASQKGSITSGVNAPWALYIDQQHNLYVANQSGENDGSGSVTVYPRLSVTPSATYTEGLGRPLYPIVDQLGDLFVGNGENGENGDKNAGAVVEYAVGSTNAYQVLQTPGDEVDGMDFDTQGNLYVAYRGSRTSPASSVEEFAPGSAQGVVLGMKLNQPQGLIVDNRGNIVVAQSGDPHSLMVFPPGSTSPHVSVKLPSGADPTQIVLRKNEHRIYVASFTNGDIYDISYPFKSVRGNMWKIIQKGVGDNGIALSNGQAF
jgi:hypothetical protein